MESRFEVLKTDPTGARLGRLTTPHGVIDTPTFMPVGTQGTVKGLTQQALGDLGVQILLGNTYHLYLRPGHERIRRLGGFVRGRDEDKDDRCCRAESERPDRRAPAA